MRVNLMNKKEIQRLVDWTKKTLNFEDICIDLCVQDDPPEWIDDKYTSNAGVCLISPALKTANIWVSPAICQNQEFSVEEVLIHEILEAWFGEAGFLNNNERKHFIVNRLGIVLTSLWRLQRRKK